jgi:predicted permease
MSPRLPRIVAWLMRAIVPGPHADMVLADLEDDYCAARDRAHPRLWLLREVSSLLGSYVTARLRTLVDCAPLLKRDAQMAARNLSKGPFAAAAAAALLAAGIVSVLLVAALADALFFRHVSATHGEALRRVVAIDRQGRTALRFSYPELQQIRAGAGEVAELGAVYVQPAVLRSGNVDLQTMVEVVDAHYFRLTGTSMIVGRMLLSSDDRAEAPPAAMISEPLWRRRFASSPAVLGTAIELNGAEFTIVGVAATLGSSTSLGASVDAWVPIAHADPLVDRDWRTSLEKRWFAIFALPASGQAALEARLSATQDDLASAYPDPWRERRLTTSGSTALLGTQRSGAVLLISVLAALATLILLASASNVASVLLARAATGRRVAAIHLSMGSGRTAIARRQIIEGLALGGLAGLMTLGLYAWARASLEEVAILPTLALRLELAFGLRTMAWTMGGALATGMLLAIGPAVWTSRLDLIDALRDGGGRSSTGRSLSQLRRALVATQVALSIVLVSGAALAARSLGALGHVDLGFERARVVAVDFDLEPSAAPAAEFAGLARQALAAVAALPAVTATAMASRAPVDPSTPVTEVESVGETAVAVGDVTVLMVTSEYFDVVTLPIVAGRRFTPTEAATRADVVIVNDALARRLWPQGDVTGRGLRLSRDGPTLRVVGVAWTGKYRTLTESARPHLYRPTPPALGLTLLARTDAEPRATLRAMQSALDAVGPGLVGFFPRTMDDHLAIQLLPARVASAAATSLGGLALVLSGTALYALVSWFVVLRRREVGVRMALGASASDVRRLVVTQALEAAAPGIVVGAALAVGAGMAARAVLFGVAPSDPIALLSGVGALAVVVLLASYVPSRRASRVDPASVLRQ